MALDLVSFNDNNWRKLTLFSKGFQREYNNTLQKYKDQLTDILTKGNEIEQVLQKILYHVTLMLINDLVLKFIANRVKLISKSRLLQLR